MRKLWLIFIAIFVFSFAILGWVGTEIFRQAPPIPREVVTTEGQVLIAAEEISNGQNIWQAMGGMESGSIWGHGSYVAPDWSADYLHREALFILNDWSQKTEKMPGHWGARSTRQTRPASRRYGIDAAYARTSCH